MGGGARRNKDLATQQIGNWSAAWTVQCERFLNEDGNASAMKLRRRLYGQRGSGPRFPFRLSPHAVVEDEQVEEQLEQRSTTDATRFVPVANEKALFEDSSP